MACRDLPITAIVHFTFKQDNAWFIERRDALLDHMKYFAPKIESKNNANLVKSTHCKCVKKRESPYVSAWLLNIAQKRVTTLGHIHLLHNRISHSGRNMLGPSIFPISSSNEPREEGIQQNEDVTKWMQGVIQDPHMSKLLVKKHLTGLRECTNMPRRSRSEAIPDVPSLSASSDGEDTLLLDVLHLVHPSPIIGTLSYKQPTHRSTMI
ncbi:hypothetical protein QQ045_008864 [Rhodiola kirilowii]